MQTSLINKVIGVFAIIATLFLAVSSVKIWESVSAGEIVICQDAVDGELHIYTDPGVKLQAFGDCTHYKKSSQLWFDPTEGEPAIKILFNDGGAADIHGSIRTDLPLDAQSMIELHTRYGSQQAIEDQLVYTVVSKAIYLTGPLMSSKESYAERRNDLVNFIEDQAQRGVYRTIAKDVRTKDPLSGEEKTVTITEIVKGDEGQPLRQERSPLEQFGIRVYNFAPTAIKYNERVERQINDQQTAIMQVQTAIANAKRAEQDAITAEQQGRADAAKAKWEQETINAKEIAEAEKRFKVAELDALSAAAEKRANILRGQGEAERKRLVMNADGALEQKLAAWVKAQEAWSKAIAEYKGAWVPTVQMGDQKGSGNGANALMDLLTTKTAKDLALDFRPSK